MSISERLKIARRTAGLSQRDLGKAAGVSAMAISKYERGEDIPSSGVFIRLAKALGVKVEYFFRPISVEITAPYHRRRISLKRKQERIISGRIQEWVERYLEVESIFGDPLRFELPSNFNRYMDSLEDIEQLALDLREVWEMGYDPIDNIVEALESNGIKVGIVEGSEDFDALTFWVNGEIPAIAVRRGIQGDRQRFSLAYELGHLVFEPSGSVEGEKGAYRFARAFLVPKPAVFLELGDHRGSLDFYELYLLKHKYGLSMQGWIQRAKDLKIITESVAVCLFKKFNQQGWSLVEPGDPIPEEEPQRMKRLVMRALAEDMISDIKASELLGKPLKEFCREEEEKHDGFPVSICG